MHRKAVHEWSNMVAGGNSKTKTAAETLPIVRNGRAASNLTCSSAAPLIPRIFTRAIAAAAAAKRA